MLDGGCDPLMYRAPWFVRVCASEDIAIADPRIDPVSECLGCTKSGWAALKGSWRLLRAIVYLPAHEKQRGYYNAFNAAMKDLRLSQDFLTKPAPAFANNRAPTKAGMKSWVTVSGRYRYASQWSRGPMRLGAGLFSPEALQPSAL